MHTQAHLHTHLTTASTLAHPHLTAPPHLPRTRICTCRFMEEEVGGEALFLLSEAELEGLGLSKIGPRKVRTLARTRCAHWPAQGVHIGLRKRRQPAFSKRREHQESGQGV